MQFTNQMLDEQFCLRFKRNSEISLVIIRSVEVNYAKTSEAVSKLTIKSLFQKSVTFEIGFQEPHFIAVLEVNLVQFQKSVWTFETASKILLKLTVFTSAVFYGRMKSAT